MDGVEGAQDGAWRNGRGGVQERSVEVDLMQSGKLAASLGHGSGSAVLDGPDDLDASEGTGHPFV